MYVLNYWPIHILKRHIQYAVLACAFCDVIKDFSVSKRLCNFNCWFCHKIYFFLCSLLPQTVPFNSYLLPLAMTLRHMRNLMNCNRLARNQALLCSTLQSKQKVLESHSFCLTLLSTGRRLQAQKITHSIIIFSRFVEHIQLQKRQLMGYNDIAKIGEASIKRTKWRMQKWGDVTVSVTCYVHDISLWTKALDRLRIDVAVLVKSSYSPNLLQYILGTTDVCANI